MTDPRSDTSPDIARLITEIEQEVERRRASGELPPDLERDLDRTFAEFAPVDAVDADYDSIVTKIERAAIIDLRPSTVSAYPGASQMKQAVAKATSFYIRHVATQASGLFQGVARALRILGERVDGLESERHGGDLALWRELEGRAEIRWRPAITPTWEAFVIEQLGAGAGPGPGRVLHAHAGDGRLVQQLSAAGYDAYGVEPAPELALAASDLAPDIRAVAVADHLATLPPASLAALVLTGVEQLALVALVELIRLAASRLTPGSTMVVLSTHPDAWPGAGPPVAVDLAPGRPLHPETWQLLLRRAGFVDIETQSWPPPPPAEVGTADFAVRARRPR